MTLDERLKKTDELSLEVFQWAERVQEENKFPLMTPILLDYVHAVKYLLYNIKEKHEQEGYRENAKKMVEESYRGKK